MASMTERMIGAARLDVKIYEEVEQDVGATQQAMVVVLISSLAAGIGALGSGFMALVVAIVSALVGWVVWAGLTFLIGTKLLPEPQTKSDVGELLRTIGFSTSPGILRILSFIPVIGWMISIVAALWMLVAMVIAVRQALDYKSTIRAVVVCGIGFVAYMLISVVFGTMFGVALLAGSG